MSTIDTPSFIPGYGSCTEVNALCPVEASTYGDYFNLGGCIFLLIVFTLCLIAQIGIGAWGRTWSFSIFLGVGTILEIAGYAARITMTPIGTVWNYPSFVTQLVMLILAPTFVAAAIAVTFKWIVIYVGPQYSFLQPKWYPWFFVGLDLVSILIQAAGGGIAASFTDDNVAMLNVGKWLLIAGTAFQAANMTFSGGLMALYWWRYQAGRKRGDQNHAAYIAPGEMGFEEGSKAKGGILPQTRFRMYLWAIIVAYMAILVRCIYRIPEMAGGWGSTLMQNETLFMILDGAMIALAVILLTAIHPAIFFPILRSQSKGGRVAPSAHRGEPLMLGSRTK